MAGTAWMGTARLAAKLGGALPGGRHDTPDLLGRRAWVREGGEERGWFGRPHAWEREEGEEREGGEENGRPRAYIYLDPSIGPSRA